ncbi:MAG: endonuclease [Bacteroidota bacterium]|nr:endonuclease [Bacteroidota bacterium]
MTILKKIYRLLTALTFIYVFSPKVFPQAGTYYNSISTSSPTFITDLENRIRNPYIRVSYDNFDETNIANFASIDNGNGTRSVFCVYTGYEYIYSGTFTWSTMSREHTWAQSWMPNSSSGTDQYSDQYHLFPTHNNNANGRRSNHPLGVVVNVTYQFLEGKVGTNANGEIVYEPRDIHKGDAARALFYMSVRYDDISGLNWDFNWLNNTKLPSLSEAPQDINILMDWNRQDPPDKWEVDRNNYIQSIQQNRNPFADHPEYLSYIEFSNLTKLNPVFAAEATNHVTNFASVVAGNSIQLNWNDATGSQLPSGYLLMAYNENNYFIPVDGSLYSNDTVLTDGYSLINIPYANANTYNFSNLIQNNTYYFTIYSYNGSGSQINYKTDGIFPLANSTITSGLAAEPANYISNFASSNITSGSVQLNWTDALPGSQIPSAYLISANNHNSFIPPSDGVTYTDDVNLADGNALVNINYNAADNYIFNNLFSNTNYYFKIYSYNGTGTQINYKTNGTVPFLSAVTSGSAPNVSSVLLDNFNRSNNNVLGNTLLSGSLLWQESETINPTSINLNSNHIKQLSTTAGREFANVNMGGINGYPIQLSSSGSQLTWAFNMRQSRLDPSGFDNSNYGVAFVIGKTNPDVTSGNGYAIVLGQSGSTNAIRLAKFTNGMNANSKFVNVISSGNYSNQFLSIKVIYDPAGNNWSLFVDSSTSGFAQADPRNTSTQVGTAPDNSYTSSQLTYLGVLWNHATGANDSSIFDEIYVPGNSSTTIDITAIPEGYFETGANKLNKSDTVTAYLRSSSSPFQIVDSARSIIDSLTFTGSFIYNNVTTGNYYISLIHRSFLETWSSLPQSITSGSSGTSYDFTTSINKAYGNNLIFKNGKYCIYSGDANSDGTIDVSDLGLIDNDAANFVSGYVNTDINGDNFVDVTDQSITDNNAFNFITKITP